jgi:hypothetical protein
MAKKHSRYVSRVVRFTDKRFPTTGRRVEDVDVSDELLFRWWGLCLFTEKVTVTMSWVTEKGREWHRFKCGLFGVKHMGQLNWGAHAS